MQPNGAVELRVHFDMLAYALDQPPNKATDEAMNDLLDGSVENLQLALDAAHQRFLESTQILGGRQKVSFTAVFPSAAELLDVAKSNPKQRLPIMGTVQVTSKLPSNSATISFRFPHVLGAVILTTEFPYREPYSEPVEPGSTSTALRIPTEREVRAAAVSMNRDIPVSADETGAAIGRAIHQFVRVN